MDVVVDVEVEDVVYVLVDVDVKVEDDVVVDDEVVVEVDVEVVVGQHSGLHVAGHVCRTNNTWSQYARVTTIMAQAAGSAHSKSGPHFSIDVVVDVDVLVDVDVEVVVGQHSGKHDSVQCD